MGYNYRCTHKHTCGARKTLPRKIEQYVRKPKCPGCKKDTLKLDASVKKWNEKNLCRCDGLHHPHMKGYGNCKYNPQKDWDHLNDELGVTSSDAGGEEPPF